jgi:NADH-quinone oxidoreductase subunit C
MSEATDMPDTDAPPVEDGGRPEWLDAVPSLAEVPWARTPAGQDVVFPAREAWVATATALRDEAGFEMCADLCAVDYLLHRERELPDGVSGERFEVVANLLSIQHRRRLRLRVQVPEEDAAIPTLFEVYPGTEAMEREAFDMFGVLFSDHPDLTRILMPEDWEGHPLRKDYAVGRVPVQFKEAPGPR